MEKSKEVADTYSRVKDSSELLGSFVIEPIAVLVLVCLLPLVGFLLFHLYMCFQGKCGAGSKKVCSFKILSNVLFLQNYEYYSQENIGNNAVKRPWNTTDGYKWQAV